MDSKKAKIITLISLVLINIFLFVIHLNTDAKYELTSSQIQNIKSVLTKNNIAVYSLIPSNYSPMQELELTSETESLTYENFTSFISSDEEIISMVQDKKNIYLSGSTRILIDGEHFIVDKTDNNHILEIGDNTVSNLSTLIENMGDQFENYKLDKEIISKNSVKYEFREIYEDQKIYDNYIQFILVDNQLFKVQGKYTKIDGFVSEPQEIISADIALFTFMSIIKENNIYDTDEIFINNIDIVYYKNYELNSNYDIQPLCVPAYRIYTEQGELPFIINAYTNKLMNY